MTKKFVTDNGRRFRKMRGARWIGKISGRISSACRHSRTPGSRYEISGFRCVLADDSL